VEWTPPFPALVASPRIGNTVREKANAAKAKAAERQRRYAQTANARRVRAARAALHRERLKTVDEIVDDDSTPQAQ
jgi:hypothetical protein